MNSFGFKTQLAMSTGTAIGNDVEKLLLEKIPGSVRVVKADTKDDRTGTDYWIEHVRGAPISVDTKVRNDDPVQKYGEDDLALETLSVVEQQKIGWTLDETKRTDYILWWFIPTRRWVLVPFLQLQAAFRKRLAEWRGMYRSARQRTTEPGRIGWHSECLFVPREAVWAAIYEDFGGLVVANSDAPARVPHAIRKHVGNGTQPRGPLTNAAPRCHEWEWACLPCDSTWIGRPDNHVCSWSQPWRVEPWVNRLSRAPQLQDKSRNEIRSLVMSPISRVHMVAWLGPTWSSTSDVGRARPKWFFDESYIYARLRPQSVDVDLDDDPANDETTVDVTSDRPTGAGVIKLR